MRRGINVGYAKLMVLFLAGLGVCLGFAPVAAQDVTPPIVEEALHPNEFIDVTKEVTTAPIPPVIDIFLLEDETGSFFDDIETLQALAPEIWEAIEATGINFTMGVGGFRDFDQDFWGSPGDWVYRRHQDLTITKSDFVNGVNALTAGGGADGPEAQLEALHYIAVPGHPAIDSNGDGDTTDSNDTPMGEQPSWREGAQRVVLLATDASCHVTGDSGGWPGDAGTTSPAVTAGILDSAGITVIGLVPLGAGSNACVDTLASGTGGSVQATTATGEDILEAILAGLEELTTDVWWETDCGPEIIVTLEPDVRYDVPGETTVSFSERIEVANNAAPGEYDCVVTFIANEYPDEGAVIGEEEIHVTVLDGRMTGGGKVLTGDEEEVTHGFELHCACIEEPNNLQVNWGKGNKFHLEDLTFALCSDRQRFDEKPPVAGFDTIVGRGQGRYNGVSGANIRFTFIDAGEPGKNDLTRMVIRDADGNIVLKVAPRKLIKGNHQAHKK